MSIVYIKKVNKDLKVNLTNINKKRAEYLSNLKGNTQLISYCSWIFLKEIIKENYNLNIDELDLCYNDFKKPYFKDNPFFFNISHSKDIIAIAISSKEVGVDIQVIENNTYVNRLAKKMNLNDDIYEVIKKFSSLEAYYKKIGTGLYPSQLTNNIQITHQEILNINNQDYVLSVSFDDESFKVVHI